MEDSGNKTSEDSEMTECNGEKVVTMMDVLQEQQDFEDDANAVLGASDDKNCTYSKGYVKRQAVYACLTCCPDAPTDPIKRAGVCLACSLACHENHELVELYTKRNFRCDCGNPKFTQPCQFTPNKSELNYDNKYNQNFSGVYCTCKRPYPDPEATEEEEMIQCIICEDWLHTNHLEATVPSNDQYAEMICKECMDDYGFLHDYSDLVVNIADKEIIVMDPDLDFDIKEQPVKPASEENRSNGIKEIKSKEDDAENLLNSIDSIVGENKNDTDVDMSAAKLKQNEDEKAQESKGKTGDVGKSEESKGETGDVGKSEESKGETGDVGKTEESNEETGDVGKSKELTEDASDIGKFDDPNDVSSLEKTESTEIPVGITNEDKKEEEPTEDSKIESTTDESGPKEPEVDVKEQNSDIEKSDSQTEERSDTQTEDKQNENMALESTKEVDTEEKTETETIPDNKDKKIVSQEDENKQESTENAEPTVENKEEESISEKVDQKRKLSTDDVEDDRSTKKAKIEEPCLRPRGVKRVYKGATFWPNNFRQKLCTCGECIAMYKDLAVMYLIDLEDTVTAYEALGKENSDGTPSSQYEKGLQALSSLDRVQQINALTEYNKMRDKLLDFLKSFKERKEVVKEEDIKAFFAGMKPKREPDGVYFCR